MAEQYELAENEGEQPRTTPADVVAQQERKKENMKLAINGVAAQLDSMGAFTHASLYTTNVDSDRLSVATLPLSIFGRSAAILINHRHRSADLRVNEEHCDSLAFVIDADKVLFAGRALQRMTRQDYRQPWPRRPNTAYISVNESKNTASVDNGFAVVNAILDDDMESVVASLPQHVLPAITQYHQHISRITPYLDRCDDITSVTLK